MKCLLLLLFTVAVAAQTQRDQTIPITVLVLNGRNGKPITRDWPNVSVDSGGTMTGLKTNNKGEVVIRVSPQAKTIKVLPRYYFDCRLKEDNPSAYLTEYPLEAVIKTGIVTENLCGKQRRQPIPGTIILYARPRSLREMWDL